MADLIGKLDIYRKGEVLATIDIDKNTVYNGKLQSTKSITCQTLSVVKLPIEKEDYIIWDDEVYTLDKVPELGNDGSVLSKDYKMVFQATRYHLLDWFVQREDKLRIFPYVATAKEHCLMIIASANNKDMNWAVGEVDDTEPFLIEYDWHYALPAIEEVATKAKLEFEFIGKTLRMVKSIGRDTGLVFKVGQGQGLHKIQRSSDTSKSAVNRVYGIGGTKNIDSSYRTGLEKNLVFDGEYVETPELTAYLNGTGPYVRLKEVKYTNEERYPHFSGVVAQTALQTGTDGKVKSATITDPNINFDINLFLLPGIKATVTFLSGSLTGKEYELTYNHSTKTVTLVPDTDTNGYTTPNDVLYPEVGDKFTFLKIKLPAEYYVTEELKLKQESQQYLLDNQYDRLLYGIEPDPHHLRVNQIKIKEGDRSTVQDEEMDLDEVLRIVDVSYPLVDRYSVTALIGNEIVYDRETKPYADAIEIRQQVKAVDRRSEELAKRGVQELRIYQDKLFDTDGKIKSENINVAVLEALLGIFGAKSQNFRLSLVYITDNYLANPNSVAISSGELIHREYSNPGDHNVWQLQSIVQNNLVADQLYWVYCKCSKSSQVGSYVITTEELMFDSEPNFWLFLAGMIYPVINGYRDSDFTNGIADINGNRLKIGKIISRDGLTGFDLDNNIIFGKITFRNTHGELKDINSVDEKSQLADANALAAQIIADAAMKEVEAFSNDGILDASEKVRALQDFRVIQGNLATRIAQATTYGISAGAYNTSFVSLENYLAPLFANMSVNSPIDRDAFIDHFKAYYNAEASLLRSITDSTKSLISNISVGGRNYFRRTTPLEPVGLTHLHHTNGNGLGTGEINGFYSTGANATTQGVVRVHDVITSNGEWTVSGYYISNGDWSVGIDICDLGYTNKQVSTEWTYFELTVNVTNWSSQTYNFVDFANIPYAYFNVKDLMIEKSNKASDWRLAPEDSQDQISQLGNDIVTKAAAAEQAAKNYAVSQDAQLKVLTDAYADGKVSAEEQSRINQAASNLATARSEIETARLAAVDYANSQIAIANANVLSSAAATAQTKADASRNAAITSSQEYARAQDTYLKTLTDSYADGKVSTEEQARIAQAASILQAAKDDATTKANTAAGYGQAAQTAYNQLTAALKPLAYQDQVQLSQLNSTVISNGMLVNTLIDTNFVRSNIINVGYIQGMSLDFTQGRVGGWNITSTNLYGSNGGTTIELNVTNNDPFFQVVAANGSFTRINYQGVRTTYTVTDDVKVLRAMFINADRVFFKTGVDSNGDDQYGGRVGDYGSNGYAFIERNGGSILINTYDITANHFMTGNNVRYNTLTNLSDIRFKKGIKTVKYGLKEIVGLEPIQYKYKLPKGDKIQDTSTHMGFSAQQVREIIPELVLDGDRLSMSMIELIPVMVNAIKQLNNKIEILSNKQYGN
jgi:hypothetical protein